MLHRLTGPTGPLTYLFLLAGFLCLGPALNAQNLQANSKLQLTLGDGTDVVLYRSGTTAKWYYLPPASSIRVAKDEKGKDKFLFIKFTTEDRADQGGVQGGLLHFLLEWSLEPNQSAELAALLRAAEGPRASVAGPVDLQPNKEKSFAITSATLLDKELTRTLVTSGMAPVMEGGRVAIAARLDKNGAQLLEHTMKKNRGATDFTVEFYYTYTMILNGAKGTYEYDLNITHEQGDAMVYDLIKKELDNKPELIDKAIDAYNSSKAEMPEGCGVADGLQNMMAGLKAIDMAAGNNYDGLEFGTSESMMRKLYDYFADTSIVSLEWEQEIVDDRVDAFRDAFFQMFLQDVAEPSLPEYQSLADVDQPSIDIADESVKEAQEGGYHFQSCTQLETTRSVYKKIKLDKLSLPVNRPHAMVYNLPGGFKTLSVNLNDPFFEHRDINFIVDVEAMDIFKEEVNYVTVNVRKRRNQGRDFADAITLSPEIMQDKGRLAQITYARGEDTNPDLYEYKAQWSLRGGELYPPNPSWQRGDWQAVTLEAPIRPRTIEFEADVAELQEAGVTRATLQLRYLKYGREMETNIPLTVSKNEPLVAGRIYTDREQTGYAYRFIINHKEEGKLATRWEAKINDDYVYATVPEELRKKDLEWLKVAKEAANVLLQPGPDGTIKPGEGILGKFKDLLNVFVKE